MIDWNMYALTKDSPAGPVIQLEPSPFELTYDGTVDEPLSVARIIGQFISAALIIGAMVYIFIAL